MNTKDFFAAKAMQGLLASGNPHPENKSTVVQWSWEYAEAMMKERAKHGVEQRDRLKMIPKTDMKDKHAYLGHSRKGYVAIWDAVGKYFLMHDIGARGNGIVMEHHPHFEDVRDTNKDGFIPLRDLQDDFKAITAELPAVMEDINPKPTTL